MPQEDKDQNDKLSRQNQRSLKVMHYIIRSTANMKSHAFLTLHNSI